MGPTNMRMVAIQEDGRSRWRRVGWASCIGYSPHPNFTRRFTSSITRQDYSCREETDFSTPSYAAYRCWSPVLVFVVLQKQQEKPT